MINSGQPTQPTHHPAALISSRAPQTRAPPGPLAANSRNPRRDQRSGHSPPHKSTPANCTKSIRRPRMRIMPSGFLKETIFSHLPIRKRMMVVDYVGWEWLMMVNNGIAVPEIPFLQFQRLPSAIASQPDVSGGTIPCHEPDLLRISATQG